MSLCLFIHLFCVCMLCARMWVWMCHNAHVEVRGQILGLVLCFYTEGPRYWTQKFGKQLYPLSHLTSVWVSDLHNKMSDTHIKETIRVLLVILYSPIFWLVEVLALQTKAIECNPDLMLYLQSQAVVFLVKHGCVRPGSFQDITIKF